MHRHDDGRRQVAYRYRGPDDAQDAPSARYSEHYPLHQTNGGFGPRHHRAYHGLKYPNPPAIGLPCKIVWHPRGLRRWRLCDSTGHRPHVTLVGSRYGLEAPPKHRPFDTRYRRRVLVDTGRADQCRLDFARAQIPHDTGHPCYGVCGVESGHLHRTQRILQIEETAPAAVGQSVKRRMLALLEYLVHAPDHKEWNDEDGFEQRLQQIHLRRKHFGRHRPPLWHALQHRAYGTRLRDHRLGDEHALLGSAPARVHAFDAAVVAVAVVAVRVHKVEAVLERLLVPHLLGRPVPVAWLGRQHRQQEVLGIHVLEADHLHAVKATALRLFAEVRLRAREPVGDEHVGGHCLVRERLAEGVRVPHGPERPQSRTVHFEGQRVPGRVGAEVQDRGTESRAGRGRPVHAPLRGRGQRRRVANEEPARQHDVVLAQLLHVALLVPALVVLHRHAV